MFTPRRRLLIAPNRTHSTNVSKLERAKSSLLRVKRSCNAAAKSVRPGFKSLIVLVDQTANKIRTKCPRYKFTAIHCQGVGLGAGVFDSRSVVCSSVFWDLVLL